MAVSILRKTGFWGPWGNLSLVIQGEAVATIANNQSVSFEITQSPVYLSVQEDPKSAILVSDHQKYILCIHPYFQFCYLVALSFLIFSFIVDILSLKWILLISYIILIVVANFCLPRYCFKACVGPKIKIKEFC